MVQKYIQADLAGQSLLKQGTPGIISDFIYDTICNAFKSHIKINQYYGKGGNITCKMLSGKLNGVIGKTRKLSIKLLNQLVGDNAFNVLASKCGSQEEQHIRWTTYSNLKSWFDNFETDLVELGFAHKDADGNTIIPNNQLKQNVIVDETCLEFVGGQQKRGGHPAIVYAGKLLPEVGKAVSKSSMSMTMITWITAAWKAIPPHFQFSTMTQSEETMKLCVKTMEFMPNILEKFGCDDLREWPVTLGMNKREGRIIKSMRSMCWGPLCHYGPTLKMSQEKG